MTTDDQTPPSEPILLGQRLREARESLGLPQAAVADHLEIPRTSVSEIEAGRRRVSFLELRQLAKLYRRPMSFFSGDEPDNDETDETRHALFRTTSDLSESDREQVLRFAQFLRDAGPAKPPERTHEAEA